MKFKLPKTTMFGNPIESSMERILEKERNQGQIPLQAQGTTAPDKKGMIYIPSVGLYFAKERTHLNEDWNQTHLSLAQEGLRMPTINEFRQTLAYLKSSQTQEHQKLYREITEIRNPWRANWIDAYFEKKKDGLYLLTGNKAKEEKLEDCLMQDKTPGINIENWLDEKSQHATSQGLPKPNIAIDNKGLYYRHPVNGSVARFLAGSAWADLYCNGNPSNANSSLGVFGVVDDSMTR